MVKESQGKVKECNFPAKSQGKSRKELFSKMSIAIQKLLLLLSIIENVCHGSPHFEHVIYI